MVSVCLPSDALLQHLPSYSGFPYLGRGVSLHGCSSKAQPLLLTLDEGHLLTAALPGLQRGTAPPGPPAPGQPLQHYPCKEQIPVKRREGAGWARPKWSVAYVTPQPQANRGSGEESTCQCRRRRKHGFDPWVGKILWRRKWQPTPVFLPGESLGQRSLAGYSSWDWKELDMVEHAYTQTP